VLYGTTLTGGANGKGTVFSVTPAGKESVLYSFGGAPGDGAMPYAGLTVWGHMLAGTTTEGGAYNEGTAYTVTTSGTEVPIYSFGFRNGGRHPYAGVTVLNQTLYGATAAGGAQKIGTFFSIAPNGAPVR
jgi:uncharacterized repeat protein (TIGR03803 family)